MSPVGDGIWRHAVTASKSFSSILLTGGTGTLGQFVETRLRAAGYPVRVLSRHEHEARSGVEFVTGDLVTGAGLEAAVSGIRTIVHLGGSVKGDDAKTQNLIRAAVGAGVQHLVYISVVGADRVPVVSGIDRAMFGYFASKLAAERVVTDSGLPWTILRATQFQESLLNLARGMAKLPVIPVPAFKYQPIAADEVAARLVELVQGTPAGWVPDIAGPRVWDFADLVREYLRVTNRHRVVVRFSLPGQAFAAIRAGAGLAPDRAVGHRSWEAFLAEQAR
ncbi:MAG: SDR family oxidoreductase [Gemmatimonadales bacterium]